MHYSFDTTVAQELGVNEAIFINNLQFWLRKNQANEKHRYDGRTWTYNSRRAFVELFPFWTERQVRHLIDKLIDKGIVLCKKIMAKKSDHTNWYAFNDEEKYLGKKTPNNTDCPIEQAKMSNHDMTNLSDLPLYTDIKTTNTIMSSTPTAHIDPVDNFKKLEEDIKTGIDENYIKNAEQNFSRPQKALFVLAYLNCVQDTQFRPVRANIDLILNRLKEGHSIMDFLHVIHAQRRAWKSDEKMKKYLRPKTLFNATNFANYLGQANQ